MLESADGGISVSEAVKQFKASQEPEPVKPTESNDVVNVSEEAQEPEETETLEASEPEQTEESETVQVEEAEADDSEGDLFYDLDGEEVSAESIRKWKAEGLMQADYTRKTQAHSEEVKQFKIQQEAFNTKQQLLDEKLSEFEAVMGEDSISAEELSDLREYEPEKYIEHIEKKQKRDKLISESKTLTAKSSNNFEEEYSGFVTSQEGWLTDGKLTDKSKADITLMTSYADSQGYSNDDITGMKSHHFKTLLDAAKYNASKKKADVMTKKVRKAPAITKPRQQAKTTLQTEIQAAEATLKRTGKVDDAVKLARLKRQLNN